MPGDGMANSARWLWTWLLSSRTALEPRDPTRSKEHVATLCRTQLPASARAEPLPVQFISHGAERVDGHAEFMQTTERPLFIGV